MHDERDRTGEFERAFERWAAGPVRTAAGDGARRVTDRLPVRDSHPLGAALATRIAVFVGAAVVVGVAWRSVLPPSATAPPVATVATRHAAPPLPANVMVFWIDKDTPVYFVTRPFEPEEASR